MSEGSNAEDMPLCFTHYEFSSETLTGVVTGRWCRCWISHFSLVKKYCTFNIFKVFFLPLPYKCNLAKLFLIASYLLSTEYSIFVLKPKGESLGWMADDESIEFGPV